MADETPYYVACPPGIYDRYCVFRRADGHVMETFDTIGEAGAWADKLNAGERPRYGPDSLEWKRAQGFVGPAR